MWTSWLEGLMVMDRSLVLLLVVVLLSVEVETEVIAS